MTNVDDGFDAIFALASQGDFAAADALVAEKMQATGGKLSLKLANLLVVIKLKRGQYAEALGMLEQTAPFMPDDSNQLQYTAIALLHLGRTVEALVPMRRALELYPDNAQVHLMLSLALPVTGSPNDFKAAQDHAFRATQLEPNNPDAFVRYGAILQHSSRIEESEAALRRALELNPNHGLAWEQLGHALLELDQVDAAKHAYETTLTLTPSALEAPRELKAIREMERSSVRVARYPRTQKEFADVQRIIDRYIVSDFESPPAILSLQSTVFTLGSCFAKNIANSLRKYGVAAQNVLYPDDINNTYANKYLLEWLLGRNTETHRAYQEAFGEKFRTDQVAYLRKCDVVIISLGVAPCFFDRETDEFVLTFGQNLNIALQNGRYKFRTTTVTENVDNLHAIIRMLRELNPSVKVFLTVSPVPLKATFERGSAIVGDCVSKSTLRVAAEEILRSGTPDIFYWPSFEIVRWAGGHTGDAFGVDDGSPFHVTQALVERIMYTFVRVFGTPELAEVAASKRAAEDAVPVA